MGQICQALNSTGEKYYIIYNIATVPVSITMTQIEKNKIHINFATKNTPWGGQLFKKFEERAFKKGYYINDKTQANVIIYNIIIYSKL